MYLEKVEAYIFGSLIGTDKEVNAHDLIGDPNANKGVDDYPRANQSDGTLTNKFLCARRLQQAGR
jgi:hypothetical protein